MKVLILSQWFEPEPFLKGVPFAKALIELGYDVEVLTGFPNYPSGKLYPGYRLLPFCREKVSGIDVIRVALYPNHGTMGLKRILNYVSFMFSGMLFGPLLVSKPDIVYVYNLPTAAACAKVIGFFSRSKVIVDVQDLWPESVTRSGMMKFKPAIWLLHKICDYIYNKADHLIVQSPGFKRALEQRGVKSSRISVIYNWCQELIPSIPEINSTGSLFMNKEHSFFNIVYAGTMGRLQALDSVLDAACLVWVQCPAIQFWFIGDGTEFGHLQGRVIQENIQNVKFVSRVTESEISRVFQHADALLVHLKKDPVFEVTIPSKIQGYLYAGCPIIAGIRGDAAELILQSGGGLLCDPEDPSSIAEAVRRMKALDVQERKKMGERGRQFYFQKLSMRAGVEAI